MSRGTPLSRPQPAAPEDRRRWPGPCLAVVGRDAAAFGAELHRSLQQRGVDSTQIQLELRHGAGSKSEPHAGGVRIWAHPDAAAEALLEQARAGAEGRVTVGIGIGFAACVRPDRLVWIRERALPPPALAPVLREADLVLEEARPGVARELAAEWARTHP